MKANMSVKLLVIQGRPYGKSLVFPVGDYYFGRGPECHVRPESDWVSRQHCLMRVTAAGAFVRDLGSRNGTLVNGALLQSERQLSQGDQVQIGPLVFEVHMDRPAPTEPLDVADADAVTLGADSQNTAELEVTQPGAAGRGEAIHDEEKTHSHPALPFKSEDARGSPNRG